MYQEKEPSGIDRIIKSIIQAIEQGEKGYATLRMLTDGSVITEVYSCSWVPVILRVCIGKNNIAALKLLIDKGIITKISSTHGTLEGIIDQCISEKNIAALELLIDKGIITNDNNLLPFRLDCEESIVTSLAKMAKDLDMYSFLLPIYKNIIGNINKELMDASKLLQDCINIIFDYSLGENKKPGDFDKQYEKFKLQNLHQQGIPVGEGYRELNIELYEGPNNEINIFQVLQEYVTWVSLGNSIIDSTRAALYPTWSNIWVATEGYVQYGALATGHPVLISSALMFKGCTIAGQLYEGNYSSALVSLTQTGGVIAFYPIIQQHWIAQIAFMGVSAISSSYHLLENAHRLLVSELKIPEKLYEVFNNIYHSSKQTSDNDPQFYTKEESSDYTDTTQCSVGEVDPFKCSIEHQ